MLVFDIISPLKPEFITLQMNWIGKNHIAKYFRNVWINLGPTDLIFLIIELSFYIVNSLEQILTSKNYVK